MHISFGWDTEAAKTQGYPPATDHIMKPTEAGIHLDRVLSVRQIEGMIANPFNIISSLTEVDHRQVSSSRPHTQHADIENYAAVLPMPGNFRGAPSWRYILHVYPRLRDCPSCSSSRNPDQSNLNLQNCRTYDINNLPPRGMQNMHDLISSITRSPRNEKEPRITTNQWGAQWIQYAIGRSDNRSSSGGWVWEVKIPGYEPHRTEFSVFFADTSGGSKFG